MEKITIITGGSGGIGRDVVTKFLNNNHKVIVLDINEIKDEEILSNENFYFIKTDVTNPDEIEKAKNIIEKEYGYIDNIISMAGINMKSEIGGLKTITLEDIDKSVKLNLTSHIYIVKILLELIEKCKEKEKTITIISSINAITDYGLPAYSAGKAGIYGFMNAVTRELGQIGIRINTISLGTVPHSSDDIENNEYFVSKLSKLAMGKFVQPVDVADALDCLINHMHAITGQNIVLDMGQSI